MDLDKIFWFFLPKTVSSILGKLAGGVTSAYSTHLRLVAYAIQESSRGELKIKRLDEIEKNLNKINQIGRDLLFHLPKDPEPYLNHKYPIEGLTINDLKIYFLQSKRYVDECTMIVDSIEKWIRAIDLIVNDVERDIKKIENGLFNYKNSRFSIFKKVIDISIENRIRLLRLHGWGTLSDSKELKSTVVSLLKKYKKLIQQD